jgi:hypothetical protein
MLRPYRDIFILRNRQDVRGCLKSLVVGSKRF